MICHHNNTYRDLGRFRMMRFPGSAAEGAGGAGGDCAPPDRLAALDSVPLFAGLPLRVKRTVAGQLDWRNVAAGTDMLTPGAQDGAVFLLVSGTARVSNRAATEKRAVRAWLEPGEVFGELAAFDPAADVFVVSAETDCTVALMKRATFLDLVTGHKILALSMIQRLTRALGAANGRIDALTLMDARQRVAYELDRLSDADPGHRERRRIHPVPTQAEIAAAVGLTRQTVARLFGEFLRAGLIERRGRTLRILKPGALREVFENGSIRDS